MYNKKDNVFLLSFMLCISYNIILWGFEIPQLRSCDRLLQFHIQPDYG